MRYILWCLLCEERERNGRSYCAACEGEIEEALRKFEELMADG